MAVITAFIGVVVWLFANSESYETVFVRAENDGEDYAAVAVSEGGENARLAVEVLAELEVKGRAPKTGYTREEFYGGWPTVEGCSLRQKIIRREFGETAVILDGCNVVALSDAWQKGAQYMSYEVRNAIATDPLNLLAVDGSANNQKSDGDAATWLPSNKKFRCQYVARQISVKYKYKLWVTEAEKEAMSKVLKNCPSEPVIGI